MHVYHFHLHFLLYFRLLGTPLSNLTFASHQIVTYFTFSATSDRYLGLELLDLGISSQNMVGF